MPDFAPITIQQLRWLNTMTERVRINHVEEIVAGVTEIRCTLGDRWHQEAYLWISQDEKPKMLANASKEALRRDSAKVGDHMAYWDKMHDIIVIGRMFPDWDKDRPLGSDPPIIEVKDEYGQFFSLHLERGLVPDIRKWVKEQIYDRIAATPID